MSQISPNAGQELRGKTAVITGSSSGIGRAIATTLADHGARVRIHGGHHVDRVAETVAELKTRGADVDGTTIDLREPQNQDRFVDHCLDELKSVDIWVNNAGADVLTGAAKEATFEEKLEQLWQVDVVATMRLSRRIGAAMVRLASADATKTCSILNMGWDQAELGQAGDSGELFAATKGAVMAFTRSLAKSLAPHVRVNCLAPGWVRTSWAATASAYWDQRAQRESLLGRWGEPEEVADVARFLVSPAARFVNGQVVAINGGFRATAEQRGAS